MPVAGSSSMAWLSSAAANAVQLVMAGKASAMAWSDERVELLKQLWSEGKSASQIAQRLGGVTRNAVIGQVHRLGLAGRTSRKDSPAPERRDT